MERFGAKEVRAANEGGSEVTKTVYDQDGDGIDLYYYNHRDFERAEGAERTVEGSAENELGTFFDYYYEQRTAGEGGASETNSQLFEMEFSPAATTTP